MKTNIFVNLPVKDLEKTKSFFSALGYTFNPQFTDTNAACMVIDENIFAMLITEPFYQQFIPGKQISNAHAASEVAVCLSAESREAVDVWVSKAIEMGATENNVPLMQANESMYGRSINDLDGHVWEIMWMDPVIIQK